MVNVVNVSICVLTSAFFVTGNINTGKLATLGLTLPVFGVMGNAKLVLTVNNTAGCGIYGDHNSTYNVSTTFAGATCTTTLFSLVCVLYNTLFSARVTSTLKTGDGMLRDATVCLGIVVLFSPNFVFGGVTVTFIEGSNTPNLSATTVAMNDLSGVIVSCVFVCPLTLKVFNTILTANFSPYVDVLVLSCRGVGNGGNFRFHHVTPDFGIVNGITTLNTPSLMARLSINIIVLIFGVVVLHLTNGVNITTCNIISGVSLIISSICANITRKVRPLSDHTRNRKGFGTTYGFFGCTYMATITNSTIVCPLLTVFTGPVASTFGDSGGTVLRRVTIRNLQLCCATTPFLKFGIILAIFLASIRGPHPTRILSILENITIVIPVTFTLSTTFKVTNI